MADDALDDAFANVLVLIREELDVRHRLGGHPVPVPECPLCRHRTQLTARGTLSPGGGRP